MAGEGEVSAHIERLMQHLGRGDEVGEAKRVLELNGQHPAVVALRELYQKSPDDPRELNSMRGCSRSGRDCRGIESERPDSVRAAHQ